MITPRKSRNRRSLNLEWLKESIKLCGPDQCLLWPYGLFENGYGVCSVKGRNIKAHRMAFYLANGRWPYPMARHTCDIKRCVNPHHLIEGSAFDNVQDRELRNRGAKGERIASTKLTSEIVQQIRSEYKPHSVKFGGCALARKYGVSAACVYAIVHAKWWRRALPLHILEHYQ